MNKSDAEDMAGDIKQSREDWIASLVAERDLYKGECALLGAKNKSLSAAEQSREDWIASLVAERDCLSATVLVVLERALNDDATIAGLVAALVDFANWRRPSKRDWNNGAVQDEFDSMQKKARLALVMNYGQPSSGGSGSQTGRPEQSGSGAP